MKKMYIPTIKNTWVKDVTPLVNVAYTEFKKYKARPYLNLCTIHPLTPGELIHPAMRRYTEVVQSFCE